jgi:hypothetical protein
MIRTLPVDPTRMQLVAATSSAVPVPEWAELADGSRRPSGNQARAKNEDGSLGAPLWIVDCLAAGEERAEVIGVQIATHDQPQVQQFAPIQLDGLVVRVSVGKDGKPRQYWSADGVNGGRRPEAKAS